MSVCHGYSLQPLRREREERERERERERDHYNLCIYLLNSRSEAGISMAYLASADASLASPQHHPCEMLRLVAVCRVAGLHGNLALGKPLGIDQLKLSYRDIHAGGGGGGGGAMKRWKEKSTPVSLAWGW